MDEVKLFQKNNEALLRVLKQMTENMEIMSKRIEVQNQRIVILEMWLTKPKVEENYGN